MTRIEGSSAIKASKIFTGLCRFSSCALPSRPLELVKVIRNILDVVVELRGTCCCAVQHGWTGKYTVDMLFETNSQRSRN